MDNTELDRIIDEPPQPLKPTLVERNYTIMFRGWITTNDGMNFQIKSTINIKAYSYTEATQKIKEQLPTFVARSLSSGVKLTKFNLL